MNLGLLVEAAQQEMRRGDPLHQKEGAGPLVGFGCSNLRCGRCSLLLAAGMVEWDRRSERILAAGFGQTRRMDALVGTQVVRSHLTDSQA